ncbi:MAG: DUF3427 domain-containing protein, partial [Bacteroidales bacterium]
ATGTGKTYLAAFDVQVSKPDKVLFIVHRENIARKAMETFETIIPDRKYGIYTGKQKEEAEYLFATVQALFNNLDNFSKQHFDYIVVDEVHHGGAKTYQDIFRYFETKFLLGLTATPYRGDGFNIHEIFDYNIGYEIDLAKAYENKLLSPFHYFGVKEIITKDEKDITMSDLISSKRVEYIIEKIKYYGCCSDKVKGLMFVSNINEALDLAEQLNHNQIKVKTLLGSDSINVRLEVIKELEDGVIEYLIAVDIFNEGLDIPAVNQIALFRPTQSAIVYTQQLGRGLRKQEDKQYVVVIDFIGNYKKNFLIPIALSTDGTYDKDVLQDMLTGQSTFIAGEIAINFESVAKERILESINKENFSQMKYIEEYFLLLVNKLGRIPTLHDFYINKVISPFTILENDVYLRTKYKLLKKNKIQVALGNEKLITTQIAELGSILQKEELVLSYEYIAKRLTPAKRIEDICIVKMLLKNHTMTKDQIIAKFMSSDYEVREHVIDNALLHLTKEIFRNLSAYYKYPALVVKEKEYSLNQEIRKNYENNLTFRNEIDNLIVINELEYKKRYWRKENELLGLHEYYSKEEAFKYLLLDYHNGYQVSGYAIVKKANKVIIFITFNAQKKHKQYENIFLNDRQFTWFSKRKRKIKYPNGDLTNEGRIANGDFEIEVFGKYVLNKKFLYLGKVSKVKEAEEIFDEENEVMVKYILELNNRLTQKLYEQFTSS